MGLTITKYVQVSSVSCYLDFHMRTNVHQIVVKKNEKYAKGTKA